MYQAESSSNVSVQEGLARIELKEKVSKGLGLDPEVPGSRD